MNWEDANNYCLLNTSNLLHLPEPEDLTCIENANTSDPYIWIGLKKNASGPAIILKNVDDLFSTRFCESVNVSDRNLKNVSCTDTFLLSICVKANGKRVRTACCLEYTALETLHVSII